jgi:hypothetical protein
MKHANGMTPNLKEWGIDNVEVVVDDIKATITEALSEFDKKFRAAVGEVLHLALQDDECMIRFPDIEEGFGINFDDDDHDEITPLDPLTLEIQIPLDCGDGLSPNYSFNLRDALLGTQAYTADIDRIYGLKRLSIELGNLRDEIDGHVKRLEEIAQ